MLVLTFTLACLSIVNGRTFRPRIPGGVSHSIVNLGKMDFNVYLNSKPSESSKSEYGISHSSKPYRSLKPEPEGCPCKQNVRRVKNQDPQTPHDFLTKFLVDNDIFFKDTISSVMCCSSEETQEEFILEFNPKPLAQPLSPMRQGFPAISPRFSSRSPRFSTMQPRFPPIAPLIPQLPQNVPPLKIFPIGNLFPKNMHLEGTGTIFLDDLFSNKDMKLPELKKIEIFMDPTKKTKTTRLITTTPATTPDIKIVGDKKTTILYDLITTNSSVKKDLTQDIGGHFKDIETIFSPISTGFFNHNNTL